MTGLVQTGDRKRSRYLCGLMLCLLLCGFSIAAKTALYRAHQDTVKTLTSTKAVEKDALPSATQAIAVISTSTLLVIAFTLVLQVLGLASTDRRAVTTSELPPHSHLAWFTPTLAVRPPPTA